MLATKLGLNILLRVAAEALRAKRLKIGNRRFTIGGGSVSAKFSRRRGRPPPIIYTRINRPLNALQLCR